MRDPARIDRILELVRAHWKRCPDLRLGQLITNFDTDGDGYNYEDDVLEKRLKKALKGSHAAAKEPSMKLYKMTVTIPMVVLAENAKEARYLAMKHAQDERPTEANVTVPEIIESLSDLPPGWEGRCLPYADWKRVAGSVEAPSCEMNIRYFLGKKP